MGSYHDYMGSSKKWILCEDHICHNRIVLHISYIPKDYLESKNELSTSHSPKRRLRITTSQTPSSIQKARSLFAEVSGLLYAYSIILVLHPDLLIISCFYDLGFIMSLGRGVFVPEFIGTMFVIIVKQCITMCYIFVI